MWSPMDSISSAGLLYLCEGALSGNPVTLRRQEVLDKWGRERVGYVRLPGEVLFPTTIGFSPSREQRALREKVRNVKPLVIVLCVILLSARAFVIGSSMGPEKVDHGSSPAFFVALDQAIGRLDGAVRDITAGRPVQRHTRASPWRCAGR